MSLLVCANKIYALLILIQADDHGVDGQDDGVALVADVAIAVLPSQFHLAICHTATYSPTPLHPRVFEGQLVSVRVHTQLEALLLLQVNGG